MRTDCVIRCSDLILSFFFSNSSGTFRAFVDESCWSREKFWLDSLFLCHTLDSRCENQSLDTLGQYFNERPMGHIAHLRLGTNHKTHLRKAIIMITSTIYVDEEKNFNHISTWCTKDGRYKNIHVFTLLL